MIILGLLMYHACVTRCGVRNGTYPYGMQGYDPHHADQVGIVDQDGFSDVSLNVPESPDNGDSDQ
jgi:hypothetical protein